MADIDPRYRGMQYAKIGDVVVKQREDVDLAEKFLVTKIGPNGSLEVTLLRFGQQITESREVVPASELWLFGVVEIKINRDDSFPTNVRTTPGQGA